MTRYSSAEAKEGLTALVDKALAGEDVTLTRDGKAVVDLRPSAQRAAPRPLGEAEWRRQGAARRARSLGQDFGLNHSRDARSRAVTIYLDASVVVSLFIADVHTGAADRMIEGLAEDAIVSELCALEFAASVSRGVRTGLLSEQAAQEALADFDEWRALSTVATALNIADFNLAASLVRDFATKLAAAAISVVYVSNSGFPG